MVRKIEVRDAITDSIKYFPMVEDKLQELQDLMKSIDINSVVSCVESEELLQHFDNGLLSCLLQDISTYRL